MNLEKLTASGKADLSLLAPLSEPSLSWIPIGEEMIDLAVPPRIRLARAIPYGPSQSMKSGTKRLLSSKGQGFRKLTFDICREAGFEPNVVFESEHRDAPISGRNRNGHNAGARFIARAKRAFIPVYLPLADPVPSRTLVVAYRNGRYLSKAADAFIDTFKQVMDKLVVESVQD